MGSDRAEDFVWGCYKINYVNQRQNLLAARAERAAVLFLHWWTDVIDPQMPAPPPPPGRPPSLSKSKSSGLIQQLAWMAKRPSSFGVLEDGVVLEMTSTHGGAAGLAEGWEERTDDAGCKYYQNKLTGENWTETTDESGRKFYHNASTGESSLQPLASSLRASSEISSATDKGVRSRVARRCGGKCCCMLACCVCIALLFGGVAPAYMLSLIHI